MMKEETRKAFEEMREKFGKRLFKTNEIFGISESTFYKYRKEMNIHKVVVKRECSAEEIVDLLNDCAGYDCYDCVWHYVAENGKIFEVDNEWLRFGDGEDVVYEMLEKK